MSIEKLYLPSHPKCKFLTLQKLGVLMLYFLSLPTHANDGVTLLRFSMQVGSIMYVLFIVFFLVSNSNVRRILLTVYLSLTVSAYLFALNQVFELNLFLTVFICSIIPLLSTMVLWLYWIVCGEKHKKVINRTRKKPSGFYSCGYYGVTRPVPKWQYPPDGNFFIL